ncbi:MAG: hypothetical protein QOC96_3654 [Acidobacteriota bacterium]|jgi:hypothetical protein|nr:hypothetical protein [Acidobacteriota bacterium]
MITVKSFLSLTLLLGALFPPPFQTQKAPSGPDCQSIQKHIKKTYDRFKNITTIRLDEMLLSEKLLSNEKLSFHIEVSYEGEKARQPEEVKLVFSSQSPRMRLHQSEEAIFLADNERVRSISAVDGLADYYSMTTQFEKKDVVVKYEDFVKMAHAQTVEMQLGPVETKFDKKVLKALHDFVACTFES